MAFGSLRCPKCGIKINARHSSVGTLRRCQACGAKFVLQAAPSSGCGSIVLGLLAIAVVVPLICCGGMAAISTISSSHGDITSLPPERPKKGNPNPTSQPKELKDLSTVPAPITLDDSVAPTSNRNSLPVPPAGGVPTTETSDEGVYERLDEEYGYPIHNLLTEDVANKLRTLGFSTNGARRHPNGLPDSPESKVIVAWEFEQMRDNIETHVELLGDVRGRLRVFEVTFTSYAGASVTDPSRESLNQTIRSLNSPRLARHVMESFGSKSEQTLDGVLIETFAPSPFVHLIHLKGTNRAPLIKIPPGSHDMREWTDSTGTFRVMASFVSMTGLKVKLLKEDGATIEITTSQLSEADQRFLERLKR